MSTSYYLISKEQYDITQKSISAVEYVMNKYDCDKECVKNHINMLEDVLFEDNRILLAQTSFGWKVRMFESKYISSFYDLDDILEDMYIMDEYNNIFELNDFSERMMRHNSNCKNYQMNFGDIQDSMGLMWKGMY